MVTHHRRRAILTALGLYTFAALFIGYFGVNAFTGAHGLRAQADLDQQLATMQAELGAAESRARGLGAAGVVCCVPTSIDPDMLDERARALLDLSDPRDEIFLLQPRH